MLPLKGANLQVQCAVSPKTELLHHHLQRGGILMKVNAEFVEENYEKMKGCETYCEHFQIVIVFDNAPAYNRKEILVEERDDLTLLRLAPHSPMCNPIEVCSASTVLSSIT